MGYYQERTISKFGDRLMIMRLLFAIVWCVVLYFVGCVLVGGIAGGLASARIQPGEDAHAVGAAAGSRAVQSSRILIGLLAAAISIVGAYAGVLPGFRVQRSETALTGLPRDMQKWARTREMGRAKYVWLYGVVFWGIVTGLVWSIIMATFQGWHRWPMLFVTAMIGFPICGYFFGTTMWKKMEAKYDDAIATTTVGPPRDSQS